MASPTEPAMPVEYLTHGSTWRERTDHPFPKLIVTPWRPTRVHQSPCYKWVAACFNPREHPVPRPM